MNSARLLSLALAIAIPATLTWAAQEDQHAGHHPGAAAAAPASKAQGKSAADMARMDDQTQSMAQMHEKMLAARAPE